MIFSDLVSKVWSRFRKRQGPVSMVLLLRKPSFLRMDGLSAAVERGWGLSSIDQGPDNFVTQSGNKGLVYVKPHLIGLLTSNRPYLGVDPTEHSKMFFQADQRKAWSEHDAWISLDYVRGGRDFALEYSALARLAAELLDESCSGLYIPRESSLIPNDSFLLGELKHMALKTS
jgi:hypothetical protein